MALSSTLWDVGLLMVIQQGQALGGSVEEEWGKQAKEGRNIGSGPDHWDGGGSSSLAPPPVPTSSLARRPHKRLHQGVPELPTGQQTAVANIYRLHRAWLKPVSSREQEGWPFCRAVGRTVRPCKTARWVSPAVEPHSPFTVPGSAQEGEGRHQAQVSPERRGSMMA